MAIFPRSPAASRSTKTELQDDEFGAVSLRKVSGARYIRVRITEDGKLKATIPPRASIDSVRQLIEDSRDELRKILSQVKPSKITYTSSMPIGASHTLTISRALTNEPKSRIHGQNITVWLPHTMSETDEAAQSHIRSVVKNALTKEAKAYLPRRLAYIANEYGFKYEKVRFSNAKGRWGSCSSRGTISLNVALMRLSRDLIDYVLVHELCHTRHMNHSQQFWSEVAEILPNYRSSKRTLKNESPYL